MLALNLRRLSADWERAYGHPVLLAETFVDPTRFRGTCYRAAGWACLGTTRGFAKQNTRYVAHGTPKTVWVRSLRPGAALSVDGQPLRGGHARGQAAPHLLSAILRQDAGVVAQATVPATTNEIPVLPTLLRPLPLAGTIVTADALHTQVETARLLVEEKHADYVFRVKANQATLRDDIATLRLDAFPPAGHDPRDGAGAAGDPRALGQHGPERVPRVPPCRAGLLPAAHRHGPRDPDHAD